MLKYDISFILLILSTLLSLALLLFMLFVRKKRQLHYAFAAFLIILFIWGFGHILEVHTTIRDGYTNILYINIYYFGLCFTPLCFFYIGYIFVRTKLKFSFRDVLLVIFPIVDYILLLTNSNHNLFFIKYSIFGQEAIYGSYFIFHTLISYLYIGVGLFFLLQFSIKNSGFFSKQSILIIAGVSIPIIANVLVTFNLIDIPVYLTPITFSGTILFFILAIFKFQFLNVSPIALQRVVNLISDSFIIIDSDWQVIDFNSTLSKTFKNAFKVTRSENLLDSLQQNDSLIMDKEQLLKANEEAIEKMKTIQYEDLIISNDVSVNCNMEITPITNKDKYLGTIILLKDITELKKQMEEIRRGQAILREQERLASLGNLIGGIAHNLKTPIMTISGVSKTLEALGEEYRDSIDDPEVSKEDHREIASDIIDWANKVSPYCSYMSEMISAVKGQAVQLSSDSHTIFTLYELISRINILMKFELNKYHCELKQDLNTSIYTELQGDLSILVQVFNNIITNAIQSYQGKTGVIDFKITSADGKILFVITDKGVGIPDYIKTKLFKQMVTTKGKDGTGLGMYMAYSTIRGHFNGSLKFESAEGQGTSFFIEIPIYKEVADATQ